MNYALIENDIVTNIIYINNGNVHEFPNAVSINDYYVRIGDGYVDGKFYRDGVEMLTRQQITDMNVERQISTIEEQYINLMYDYTLLELGLTESEMQNE